MITFSVCHAVYNRTDEQGIEGDMCGCWCQLVRRRRAALLGAVRETTSAWGKGANTVITSMGALVLLWVSAVQTDIVPGSDQIAGLSVT